MRTGTPGDIDFPDVVMGNGQKIAGRTFIGPGSEKDAGILNMPLAILNEFPKKNLRLFGWGWAEYGDVFRPGVRSRAEYAFEVVVTGDLWRAPDEKVKAPFQFVVLDRHNGCDDECYRQPGSEMPLHRS
jgi:hypothetical protein